MDPIRFWHILNAKQFSRPSLDLIFAETDLMRAHKATTQGRILLKQILADKIICTDFYEASTRTNLSFGSAALSLGAQLLNPNDPEKFSSEVKGESFEDSIRTISRYVDLIVLRHKEIGIAERAAAVSRVPIINAGDGAGQHPTQALLDLYTIKQYRQTINGVSIAMVGDLLHSRTVNSLCYLLAKFDDVTIHFVSPPITAIKPGIKTYLEEHGVNYTDYMSLPEAIDQAEFIYMTRIQEERFSDHSDDYRLAQLAKPDFIIRQAMLPQDSYYPYIMHPLPRDSRVAELNEINYDVDNDPRAIYFDQVENGLYVRMALLKLILSAN